jgi:hypothetical protein
MRVHEISYNAVNQFILSIIGIPLLLLMIGIYFWLLTREDPVGLVIALFSEDYRLWWVYGAILATVAAYFGCKSGNRYLEVFLTKWPVILVMSLIAGWFSVVISFFVIVLLAVLIFIVMWFLNSPYPDIMPMAGFFIIGMFYIGLSYPIIEFLLDPEAGLESRLLNKIKK